MRGRVPGTAERVKTLLGYLVAMLFALWLWQGIRWTSDVVMLFSIAYVIVILFVAVLGHARNDRQKRKRDRYFNELIRAIKESKREN